MVQSARVLVLGHGAVGRAMEGLLGGRHAVTNWDRDLDTGEETVELEAVAAEPDFILFAVPASPHQELARRVAAVMPPQCICLSVAKGLDEDGRAPYQVLAAELGAGSRRGVICGPMIAHELQQGRAGFAMLGTATADTFGPAAELFADTALRLEHSGDEAGVSWAVILKNVYVPLIGAADALELGDNVRGFLVCAILRELDAVACRMGGRPGTGYTVAGLGDLVTTATSPSSHHRQIGADLATGRTDRMAGSGKNIRGEGVHTLAVVERHGLLPIAEYPWMALMKSMLNDPADAGERLRRAVMGGIR